MNNRSLFRHFFMTLILGVVITAGAFAQGGVIDKCNCRYITIRVAPDVACKVNVVVIYPTLPSPLITVAPGEEVQVPCEDGAEVTVVDCNFQKQQLGRDGCLYNFPADFGCCIHACLTKDDNGCPLLEVKASDQRCVCP